MHNVGSLEDKMNDMQSLKNAFMGLKTHKNLFKKQWPDQIINDLNLPFYRIEIFLKAINQKE